MPACRPAPISVCALSACRPWVFDQHIKASLNVLADRREACEAWRAETAAAARIDSPVALRAAVAELEAEQAAVQRKLERARARLRRAERSTGTRSVGTID